MHWGRPQDPNRDKELARKLAIRKAASGALRFGAIVASIVEAIPKASDGSIGLTLAAGGLIASLLQIWRYVIRESVRPTGWAAVTGSLPASRC